MTSPTAETSPRFRSEEESLSAPTRVEDAVDPDGRWLYRLGGISGLLLGIGYIVIIPLYVLAGTSPSGGEAKLMYLAEHRTAWWAILGLSILTDLLFIPLALALYLALKGIHRDAMLLGTACVALFVVLDLALTWTNYATLITLSGGYAAAMSEAQRAGFVAAANYSSAMLDSPLLAFYIILVPAIGILITGCVMLKGLFSKSTAYSGIATGIVGIVAIVGRLFVSFLDVTAILVSLLTTVWVLFAGYRLYRLGQQ